MLDTQDPQESECPSSTQGEGTILGWGKDVALGGCIPVSLSASALHDAGEKGEVGTCCFLLGTRIECCQMGSWELMESKPTAVDSTACTSLGVTRRNALDCLDGPDDCYLGIKMPYLGIFQNRKSAYGPGALWPLLIMLFIIMSLFPYTSCFIISMCCSIFYIWNAGLPCHRFALCSAHSAGMPTPNFCTSPTAPHGST